MTNLIPETPVSLGNPDCAPPGFTELQWKRLTRQAREYHRKKALGICTQCRVANADKSVSRSLCAKCLARVRETARGRKGCKTRYKGARSYTEPKDRRKDPPRDRPSLPAPITEAVIPPASP